MLSLAFALTILVQYLYQLSENMLDTQHKEGTTQPSQTNVLEKFLKHVMCHDS